MNKPKILFIDIETSPNLSYIWGHYEQNAIQVVKEWQILSYAAKWLGAPFTLVFAQDEFGERELVRQIHILLNEADIVIAHNGDRFDIRKINAKILKHGMMPPSPYKTIDTKKVAKRYFALNSNKLDDIGKYLNVGQKLEHEGFALWEKCLAGDKKAWARMKKYNTQDITLLEKIYLKLRPWIKNHPNWNDYSDGPLGCPKCGSVKVKKNGTRWSGKTKKQIYQCVECGGTHQGNISGERPNQNV